MDRRWLLAGLVAVASVTSGMWLGRGVTPPPTTPSAVQTTSSLGSTPHTAASGTILVHVAGWVVEPGVVSISEGGRVSDAVAAAGGVRAGANLDGINLADVLEDGEQVAVPGPGQSESVESGPEQRGAVTGDGRIRLNDATAAEIESLPGVGPVLAKRIVDHREASGRFEQVEDLLDVSGIGEAKLAALRDHVMVP